MRRRAIYALSAVVIIGALVAAVALFPTRYRCNGDDPTFTTSQTFAEQVCVTDVTGDVVADQRIGPRVAILVVAFVIVSFLVRLGSTEGGSSVRPG